VKILSPTILYQRLFTGKFEFVADRYTAKTPGVAMPSILLARAGEAIELQRLTK
jgi:hypothetical protein